MTRAQHLGSSLLRRRGVLALGGGVVGGIALGRPPVDGAAIQARVTQKPVQRSTPGLLPTRDAVTHVQCGDVTPTSAVLWARGEAPGNLQVRLSSGGRVLGTRVGPTANAGSDLTARLAVADLEPGREYEAELWFAGSDGSLGEPRTVAFSTPSTSPAATTFAWSGDTCGQGYGINPDVGGLVGYGAVADLRPDVFIHCGDNIYADEPITDTVLEPDGSVWRNVVTEQVGRPAQTLEEFRGRYRYVLLDENVRRLHAQVPVISQWDDHETTNNWYPGERIDNDRAFAPYTDELDVDTLARMGRQAFGEYMPIGQQHLLGRGSTGFAEKGLYRKVARGAHLDVFCLDQRTFRGSNEDAATAEGSVASMGEEQVEWLIREVTASRATWKVISADQPLALAPRRDFDYDGIGNNDSGVPRGREHEIARVLSAFKAAGVRNVVWITADVHFTAAHHFSPERADFTDFDPFWEFVAGPLAASSFRTTEVDGTFGARQVFARGNPGRSRRAPTPELTFVGHGSIDADGRLRVELRDGTGAVLHSVDLEPERAVTPRA
ncbi:alkaline phosphatase D family protein [Nocardioides zeae]|uniref:Alkaline phosphatase D family protein n=1 Tax=Nocardioides imazamoxiresistens TaxID=3231893 RepID=A0ABU3PWQ5_9ACTN|nr:alkaline phosphatase D family protein [Nocardioides zeae]MDT9593668.1 alkaline phosphatase D family protein [Nocardioides zeae]